MMQGAKLQPDKKHATFTASSGRRPVLIVPGSTILLEQLDLFQGFGTDHLAARKILLNYLG